MGTEWSSVKLCDSEDGKYWYSQAEIPKKDAEYIWALWKLAKGNKYQKRELASPFAMKMTKGKDKRFVIAFKLVLGEEEISKEDAKDQLKLWNRRFYKYIRAMKTIQEEIITGKEKE